MLSKKDIITLNQQLHTGKIVNESSLDYTLENTRRSKNWLKTAAMITRAILIDHVFEDGNKRTAAAVVMTYFEANNIHYNPDNINKMIIAILKKNVTDIRQIERLIKNAIK